MPETVGTSVEIKRTATDLGAEGRVFESCRPDQHLARIFRHAARLSFRHLFASVAASALLSATAAADPCPYAIEDGDTILVASTGERIRLMGFDTPEIGAHAWCEAELRLGTLAKARLEALLCGPGAEVGIVRNSAKPVDRYGRTLAAVTLGGVDVAEIMISEGWARAYAGGRRKGWCSSDSRDDLVPGEPQ